MKERPHMVNGLHREVEGHELADRPQPVEGGADGQASEAHLGDRGVDDPLVAILLPQAARDLEHFELHNLNAIQILLVS